MRICYVGNFEPEYSTENDVRKAFEHLGHEVIPLQENDANQTVKLRDYNYDLLLWTGTWECTPEILVEYLNIIKGCAERGIPSATLHLDIFWGSDRGDRQWWLHPMFRTAYVFTADGDHQKEWELMGINHIWLPPGVRHDAAKFGVFREEYACDVAFVGSSGVGYHENVWPYRKQLVDELRSMCERNNWSFRNPGGEPERDNWGKINRDDDMNDFYASAKVTVGDSLCLKREQSHYWSDRVPEATGRGGLLIMPWIDAVKAIYPDMLMYRWGDWHDLEGKIVRLLNDHEEITDIKNKCQLITATHHTYANRAQYMLKTVGLV